MLTPDYQSILENDYQRRIAERMYYGEWFDENEDALKAKFLELNPDFNFKDRINFQRFEDWAYRQWDREFNG